MNVELGYVGNKNSRTSSTTGSPTTTRSRSVAMLNASDGGTNPDSLPAALSLRRPERVPPQRVLQLPRAAGPPEPAARASSTSRRPTRSRRSWASARSEPNGSRAGSEYIWRPFARTTTASSARTARTWRASRSPGCCRSSRTTGVLNAVPRRLAVRRRRELRQRRAPAGVNNGNFDMQGTNADGVTIDVAHITGSHQVPAVRRCSPATRAANVPRRLHVQPELLRGADAVGRTATTCLPYMKGNSYKNLDLSLFKNFPIGSKGQKIQLRICGLQRAQPPDRGIPTRATTSRCTTRTASWTGLTSGSWGRGRRTARPRRTSSDGGSSSSS